MDNVRVSIGLPVFNGEVYLEETMDAILSQTYKQFELIICDNASTDATQEICERYASQDPRIKYFRNATNLGAAANYNRTFELSTGQYFRWSAHDDLIAPTYLELCVGVLDNNPDVILCYPGTVVIDACGNYLRDYRDGYHLPFSAPHARFREFFDIGDLCHPVFGLIRSNILRQTILISNFPSSDRLLLGELAMLGKSVEVPDRLAYRRVHPNNSIGPETTVEELQNWFDPRASMRGLSIRQRLFFEYLRAIRRVKPGGMETLLCYYELFKFYILSSRNGKWSGYENEARARKRQGWFD